MRVFTEDEVEQQLNKLGINTPTDSIESDFANQVIMRPGNPFQGYSVRNLIELWEYLTGNKIIITPSENYN